MKKRKTDKFEAALRKYGRSDPKDCPRLLEHELFASGECPHCGWVDKNRKIPDWINELMDRAEVSQQIEECYPSFRRGYPDPRLPSVYRK